MLTPGPSVQRLRVHAPGAGSAEAARAQRAVRGWLDGLTPARYGLPAQAIVAVRQVQTRLPALVPRSPWPDPLLPLLRGAARPALQPAVGAAVAAVWFSDEAELLACLARDALAARSTWWWPVLVGRQPDIAMAAARWCRAPTQLPRAWQQLRADEGTAWLQAMGPGEREALQQALRSAFVVCDAVQAWLRRDDEAAPVSSPGPAGVARHHHAAPTPPPERMAADRLPRLLQALATDAMAAASAAHAAAWCPGLAPRPSPRGGDVGAAAAARLGCAAAAAAADGAAAAAGAAPQAGAAPLPRAVPATTRAGPLPQVRGAAGVDAAPRPAAGAQAAAAPAGATNAVAAQRMAAQAAARASASDTIGTAPEHVLDTRFGGLFFMINVAIAMGLYGDFTQPRAPGLAHTPWQFLFALGRRWAGPAWRSDALAPWLRAHAATQPWPRQAGASRAAAGGGPPGTRTAGVPRPAPADRLGTLAPRLAQRLALALGLPRPGPAIALTLQLPARLVATAGRVDLHFALPALPLALRLAGLDRDPGWVPAAGCDFRFHFH